MVPKTAQPCPGEPVILPRVTVSAAGMRNMSSISTKLVSGVGFSKRVGAVGVEETAAVGAEHLDRFLRSNWTLANGLRSRRLLKRRRNRVGFQVLRDALLNQDRRDDEADWQQDPEDGSSRVDPEVSDGWRLLAGDSAHQRDADGDAHRSAEEVVIGEAHHLGEVAHHRFGNIGLPIGVGGERRSGIPRQIRRDADEALRVPGQDMLQPLNGVGEQKRGETEKKHGDRIFAPSHFQGRVDAAYLVN